jgi:putative transposase
MRKHSGPSIFFSVKAVTAKGLQELYVMVWLCMTTRELIVSESTVHPNSAWVAEQTDAFLYQTSCRDEKPAIVMHDLDTKFTQEFVDKLKSKGVQHNALPKASPNLNGRCERVIFTLKHECLKKFIIFGKRHLDHLMTEFTTYYNTHRSHTERDHLPPLAITPDEALRVDRDEIVVKSYVGGLVRSFERKVA